MKKSCHEDDDPKKNTLVTKAIINYHACHKKIGRSEFVI